MSIEDSLPQVVLASPLKGNNNDLDDEYIVTYTARDAILYAIAIGFGSIPAHYEADLKYIWEQHEDFTVVPTWALTFPFWAKSTSSNQNKKASTPQHHHGQHRGVFPAFPPPIMNDSGILPLDCLKDRHLEMDPNILSQYPILHTWTCIEWKRPMEVPHHHLPPMAMPLHKLRSKFVSVQPKSVGTFVTSQNDIFLHHHDDANAHSATTKGANTTANTAMTVLACRMQSTALILGLAAESVRPWKAADHLSLLSSRLDDTNPLVKRIFHEQCDPHYTDAVAIRANHALIYRLASGDSNSIHVDPSVNPLGNNNDDDKSAVCVLHGLATLGIVTRVIIQQQRQQQSDAGRVLPETTMMWHHMEAKFTNPVMVGDTVQVQLWKENCDQEELQHVYFRVVTAAGKVAVDRGLAILSCASHEKNHHPPRQVHSKL